MQLKNTTIKNCQSYFYNHDNYVLQMMFQLLCYNTYTNIFFK